jgi:hypothetical protein
MFFAKEGEGMRRIGFASFFLTVWMGFFAGDSKAGLLPVNPTITPDGGNFRYSYAVVLTSDSVVRSGDYFTVYDFQGLVGGSSIQPAGFNFSSNVVGPTPSGTAPSDNPTISNVTWTYAGPDTVVGQTGLGNFMVVSNYGTTTNGVFTAHTHREVDGKPDSNITDTAVPVPVATPQVPEPTTLVLLGAGIPLALMLGLYRRRVAPC